MTEPDDVARRKVARTRRRGDVEKIMLRNIERMGNLAALANARGDLELLRFCGQMIERMGHMLATSAEIEGQTP